MNYFKSIQVFIKQVAALDVFACRLYTLLIQVLLFRRFTHCTAEGLSPSHDYQFRVIAENLYGRSEPCEPTSLIQTVSEQEGRRKKGLGGLDGKTVHLH